MHLILTFDQAMMSLIAAIHGHAKTHVYAGGCGPQRLFLLGRLHEEACRCPSIASWQKLLTRQRPKEPVAITINNNMMLLKYKKQHEEVIIWVVGPTRIYKQGYQ